MFTGIVTHIGEVVARDGGRFTIRAGFDRNMRGAQWIGVVAAACIADGGDVIDVDAKAKMTGLRQGRFFLGHCLTQCVRSIISRGQSARSH